LADRFYDHDGRIVAGAGLGKARRDHLYPSVTSLLGVIAKPGLEFWKRDLLISGCFDSAWMAVEDDLGAFKSRVISEMEEEQSKASDAGKLWHDDIVKHFSMHGDGELSIPWETLEALETKLKELGLKVWMQELSFTNKSLGYAGTIDAVCESDGKVVVVDWKVRTKPKIVTYDTWPMQLAAYADHLSYAWNLDYLPDIYNVILPMTEPGVIYHKHWREKHNWLDAFESAFFLWRSINNYDPITGEKFFKEDK
jgi:hypothetical protein